MHQGKNLNIQGARGLFCLMVFVFHVHNSGINTFQIMKSPLIYSSLHSLELGVELFYGISGVVILRSLTHTRSPIDFIIDRSTRILPVLWTTIAFILPVVFLTDKVLISPYLIFISMFPPLPIYSAHVNSVAWSLDYEALFYVILATIFYLGPRRLAAIPFFLISAVLLLMYPRTSMMVAGVAIFLKGEQRGVFKYLARYPFLFFLSFLLVLRLTIVCFANGIIDDLKPLQAGNIGTGIAIEVCIITSTVLGGTCLLGITEGNGVFSKFLSSKLMVFFGNISYSFYLWHIPIMAGIKRFDGFLGLNSMPYGQVVFLLFCLPISVAVSTVSFKIVEVIISGKLRRFLHSRFENIYKTKEIVRNPEVDRVLP